MRRYTLAEAQERLERAAMAYSHAMGMEAWEKRDLDKFIAEKTRDLHGAAIQLAEAWTGMELKPAPDQPEEVTL